MSRLPSDCEVENCPNEKSPGESKCSVHLYMTAPLSSSDELDAVLVNLYLGDNTTEKQPNWQAQMKNPELAEAKAKVERLISQEAKKSYEQGVRDGWNQSGEGWNGEYPGGNEQEIVDACVAALTKGGDLGDSNSPVESA